MLFKAGKFFRSCSDISYHVSCILVLVIQKKESQNSFVNYIKYEALENSFSLALKFRMLVQMKEGTVPPPLPHLG